MNLHRFTAADAADALSQIRARLGAEAVVVSVTRSPVDGVQRFWRKPRLEVVACLPEPPASQEVQGVLLDRYQQRSRVEDKNLLTASDSLETEDAALQDTGTQNQRWRSAAVLRDMGLLPLNVERVMEKVRSVIGDTPPPTLAEELAAVRGALRSWWRVPKYSADSTPPVVHVFLGPPGSGKTAALCKWLAKSVLLEGLKVHGWRLDTRAANFAGLLDFYGEILGVPIEREWKGAPPQDYGACFIDLPGVNPQDAGGLQELKARLASIPRARVHVVLNAAYETPVLLAYSRAFATLSPESDLILTHLDEEKRRGKLWNLVLGTNCAISFLAGGQNIPGEFVAATPDLLLAR